MTAAYQYLVLEPVTETIARVVCIMDTPAAEPPPLEAPLLAMAALAPDPSWVRTKRVTNYGTVLAAIEDCPVIDWDFDAVTKTLSGLPVPCTIIFDGEEVAETDDGVVEFVGVLPGTYPVLVRAHGYQHLDLELEL